MRSDVCQKRHALPPPTALCSTPWATPRRNWSVPLIGVVCSYNEIVPGHMNLDKIAEAVKAGVRPWRAALPSSFPPSPCATASPWGTWA